MATEKSWHLSRRTMLKGAGCCLALPFLEAMSGSSALAASGTRLPPTRFGIVHFSQGMTWEHWFPQTPGRLGKLPSVLSPFEAVKSKLTIVGNLSSAGTHEGKFIRGGHQLETRMYTAAKDVRKDRNSISIDQYIAKAIGGQTPLASMCLGTRSGKIAGGGSFYLNETTRVPFEGNPRLAFDRLFRGQKPSVPRWTGKRRLPRSKSTSQRRLASGSGEKSVLDLVMLQAQSLKRDLGVRDQRHLDQYMASVRDVEKRLAIFEMRMAEAEADKAPGEPYRPGRSARRTGVHVPDLPEARGYRVEGGDPELTERHNRLMSDVQVLAWQTDATRVITRNVGAWYYPDVVTVGGEYDHHALAHNGAGRGTPTPDVDRVAREALREIHYWISQQVAYMVERMDQIEEPTGTLLDNTAIVYSSDLSHGNHGADNLPVAILGRAAGKIRGGQYVRCQNLTGVAHLWVELANRVGVEAESFGDSQVNEYNSKGAAMPSLG